MMISVKPETKVLLDALVLLRRRPMEDLIHEAVLKMFGAIPEARQGEVRTEAPGTSLPAKSEVEPQETTLAGRIRRFVLREYVEPARQRGDHTIDIIVREVHRRMDLEQRYPAVIGAMQSRDFLQSGRLKLLSSNKVDKTPAGGSRKVLRFEVL